MTRNPSPSAEVLITDGHTRASLAVARSLAHRGVPIVACGEDPSAMTLHSRAVRVAAVGPSPASSEAFVDFVLALVRRHRVRLVIPVSDAAVLALQRHREPLERETTLAMASSEALRQVLDKRRNLELARALGIPCPREFQLEGPAQIPELIATLGFPIVLKRCGDPADPSVPQFGFRVLRAQNRAELLGYLDRHCRNGIYPLVQEFVGGPSYSVNCFAVKGEVVATHSYASVRDYAGNGVLRRIVEPPSDPVRYARDMLGALRWDGVANLSFYGGPGRWRYMETNGRFWGSVQGSIVAGWDFPTWVYRYFVHGERPIPGPLRIGTVSCWRYGDLALLFERLRGHDSPMSRASAGRFRAIADYVAGFHPRHHADVFRWSDPLPSVFEYYRPLRQWLTAWSRTPTG
jgi:predicted ATP-grasp superfamily ATP-dependent carboligase